LTFPKLCGYMTPLEPILKRIEANLTLRFPLFFNIPTTLYQCINSKMRTRFAKQYLWERIRKTSAFYFLKFGGVSFWIERAKIQNQN